ncbi:MAG: Lipase 1 [Candidatus Anoxychlamydiales bacterium]|nr:Lipase 1 [Candidatus Anoxychlamydiales bacterium]NGX40806.1 Lipase 1 [Candidatus Anoxychlamydiales bacterium]
MKSKEKGLKKKNMKKKTIYIFLSLIILIFAGYTFLPHFVAKYYSAKTFKDLNLEVKNITLDNNNFEYVEGRDGEPMVFVHGFQSTKSYWVPYFKKLHNKYKIIAMDLPGHGNSSRPKNQKYSLQALSASLERFIEEKKIDNFHLIGTSMGGGIATVYAHNNPDRVKSLILINPLGIDQEKKSDLQVLMEKGKNLLFPRNLEEFDEMAIFLTGKPLALSAYFKKYALTQMIKNYFFFKRAFKEMITTSKTLDDILPKIKTKTLILIGKKDKIIHPSSYEYFIRLMPNAQAVRFKNGAHAFIGKHFNKAIVSIDEFLKEN